MTQGPRIIDTIGQQLSTVSLYLALKRLFFRSKINPSIAMRKKLFFFRNLKQELFEVFIISNSSSYQTEKFFCHCLTNCLEPTTQLIVALSN